MINLIMRKNYPIRDVILTILLLFVSNVIYAQKENNGFVMSKTNSSELSEKYVNQLNRLRLQKSILRLDIFETKNLTQLLEKEKVDLSFIARLKGLSADLDKIEFRSINDFSWNGRFGKSIILLTVYKGELHGQIRHLGQSYEIQPLGKKHAVIIKYNMPLLRQKDCFIGEDDESGDLPKISIERSRRPSGSNSIVDVLFLYSRAAEATGLNPQTIAMNAIQQWNSTRNNSNAFVSMRLAGVERFQNFGETRFPRSDAQSLSNNSIAKGRRDATEADLVIILTNGTRGDYVGTAGVVADIGLSDATSYAVVQIANATSTITFAHEAGHLLAGRHQISQDPTVGDMHGHGWKKGFLFFTNRFGSIMHTQRTIANKEVERTFHFSNPNVENRNKDTGVNGESFNTRVFNLNGRVVCNYRGDQNPLNTTISGVGTATNGELLTFSANVSGGNAPFTYNWIATTISGTRLQGGTNRTLLINMPSNESMILELSVRDSNNRVTVASSFIQNVSTSGGGGDPLVFFDKENELAVEEILEVLTFPNPTTDIIQIAIPSQFYEAQLLDLNAMSFS